MVDHNENQLKDLVSRYKSSISADLYSPSDIVDFAVSNAAVDNFHSEISMLESLVANQTFTSDDLASAILGLPRLYQVVCSLLSITASIELEDGRILPAPNYPPRIESTARATADILIELGLPRLIDSQTDIRKLLLFVQINVDAGRRRNRVDGKIKSKVVHIIEHAISQINLYHAEDVRLVTTSSLPTPARRVTDYVIAVNGTPRIAIATTFQAYSGGRQSRDMSTVYPGIKAVLASNGISLLIIADGQGMKGVSERALTELFKAVPFTMSLLQAEQDGVLCAIKELISTPVQESVDDAGLRKIIDSGLGQSGIVFSESLPVSSSPARLALATYASANNHLDLILSPEGNTLTWKKASLVSNLKKIQLAFDKTSAIKSFLELLEARDLDNLDIIKRGFNANLAELPNDLVFSEIFLIAACDGDIDAEILREVARTALQSAQSSRIAVLLIPKPLTSDSLSLLRNTQAFLPVTIIVIDMVTCLALAQERDSARDRVGVLLLEQTDLTKLSPFVVRGVTPSRVFFGREEEEATLLTTLSTNSVALLGGRRIGKTSLMRHCFSRLIAADLKPVFGDCQVVRTWADFGDMAARNWSVSLPADFKPHHLFDLVVQLDDGSGRSIVIVLDEIDQLLDWDKNHTEDEVPEAFFRACRSISQQGLAQFVFSGERTIANTLWDATSPHWNFCRPLMLRQLTRAASESLIAEPLENLGIRIDERDTFLESSWNCTDGHPELLQFIGDKIVSRVNNRARENVHTSPDDIDAISNQFEYAEQYLETYWGQASPLERVISIALIEGSQSIDKLLNTIRKMGATLDASDVHGALRMLELYGIAKQSEVGYELRAEWFTSALTFYGGPQATIERFIKGIIL